MSPFALFVLAPLAFAVQDAARVERGEARGGIAFRVSWFEREDASLPARITRYTFPVACDYDSQDVRGVHPVRGGAELAEDDFGNVTMSYPDGLEIDEHVPLLVGTACDVVLYQRAVLHVRPGYVRRADAPEEIRAAFTADDEILALTDPDLAGLAAELAEGTGGELDLVLRVWRYVYENVSYGRVERPNTAAQVLRWRKGQCGEYGKLTIALLRANGIPARGVWTLRAGNTGPAGNDHAWAEAWIGGIGWFPIRPQEEPPTNDRYALGYHSYQVVCRPTCGMDEYREIEWENARVPTGYRGVGYFADVPEGGRRESIRLFQEIADAAGDRRTARRLFKRAGKAHRAVQPMLYWALAASADEKVGADAAEALVAICAQPARRLGIERFADVSPRLVQERLAAARK